MSNMPELTFVPEGGWKHKTLMRIKKNMNQAITDKTITGQFDL